MYVFNSVGRHQLKLNALTGAARYSFTYDGNGRLVAVTDGDGNQTIVERNTGGEATAIVAPGGQRTALTVNADGFLASVNNPAGNAVQLGYSGNSAPGLLTSFTDSKSTVHQFTYDADGRLIADFSPGEGTITLARTTTGEDAYEVAFKSAAGFTTVYGVEELPSGETRRRLSADSPARANDCARVGPAPEAPSCPWFVRARLTGAARLYGGDR